MKIIKDIIAVLRGKATVVYEDDYTMLYRALEYVKQRESENLGMTLRGNRERQVAFDECVIIRNQITAIMRGRA